jgi:hypothetical protein
MMSPNPPARITPGGSVPAKTARGIRPAKIYSFAILACATFSIRDRLITKKKICNGIPDYQYDYTTQA